MQTPEHIRRLRSIVLKDAQYIGIYDVNNWSKFNNFMLKLSPFKKPLYQYNERELEVLIKQLKSMRTKFNKEAKVFGTKAFEHKYNMPNPSIN